MAVRRLNHAVLYVNGLDREVEFYTRTLGFEVRMQIPGQAAFLRSQDSVNDHDLGLFEVGTGHASGRPEVGLYHLAWEVGTLAELVETRQKLVDAGALVGESDHRLSKSLYAKDPSGIEFEVLWRVPVEDWDSELAQGDAYTVPLDWDRTLTRWDPQQKTGAADFVVDTYPLLSCGDPERLCDALMAPFHDGLHFGPAAHRKLADALFDTVFSDCR